MIPGGEFKRTGAAVKKFLRRMVNASKKKDFQNQGRRRRKSVCERFRRGNSTHSLPAGKGKGCFEQKRRKWGKKNNREAECREKIRSLHGPNDQGLHERGGV